MTSAPTEFEPLCKSGDRITLNFAVTFGKSQLVHYPHDGKLHEFNFVCIIPNDGEMLEVEAPDALVSLEGGPTREFKKWLDHRALISAALSLADAEFAHSVRRSSKSDR